MGQCLAVPSDENKTSHTNSNSNVGKLKSNEAVLSTKVEEVKVVEAKVAEAKVEEVTIVQKDDDSISNKMCVGAGCYW